MFDITILSIGKIKTKYLAEAEGEYLKRLKPYAKIKMVELAPQSFSSGSMDKAVSHEGEKIEAYLNKKTNAKVFLLDERGEENTSIEFSRKLFSFDGKEIILVIGGSVGLDKKLLNKYSCLSLSKLTFLHEMTKVILLEQVYRAITINLGKEYHH